MNDEQWTNSFATEPDYLTSTEIQGRVEAFYTGPYTMQHAADCGLLALAVPTRFGGLYVNRLMQMSLFGNKMQHDSPRDFLRQVWDIRSHFDVCYEILIKGSPTQHDFYLPQLAAGKWIGVDVPQLSRMLRVRKEGNMVVLSGSGVRLWERPYSCLIVIRAKWEREQHLFVIPSSAISGYRRSSHGRHYWWIDRYTVRSEAMLSNLATIAPNTEKWEATRWNTDRSAS